MEHDLIIIGAGPAGLTAAVYAARYKLSTLVIGQLPGGYAGEAYEIGNFPSYKFIRGVEFVKKMVEQVIALGVLIKQDEVLKIVQTDEGFEVQTKKEKFPCKKVILATGFERMGLGLEKEAELTGKGISYCATCDASFCKDKVVGVVGGGNAALSSAILLSQFAKQVYIIYRRDNFFRAEPIWVEQIEKNPKIKPVFKANVKKLIGDKKLEAVELDNGEKIALDNLFIEVGGRPCSRLFSELEGVCDEGGIKVDNAQRTNIQGLFAAGDVTNNPLKQIITACSEGAVAVHTAYEELKQKK